MYAYEILKFVIFILFDTQEINYDSPRGELRKLKFLNCHELL